jgi:hypothetical protein
MPAGLLKTYDPTLVAVSIGAITLQGLVDGEFIKLARVEDAVLPRVGADGEIARAINRNKLAELTVTIMHTSLTNDQLSLLAKTDELTGKGLGSFFLKDFNGNTLASALYCWVKKRPEMGYGKEIADRVWVFNLGPLEEHIGGNVL